MRKISGRKIIDELVKIAAIDGFFAGVVAGRFPPDKLAEVFKRVISQNPGKVLTEFEALSRLDKGKVLMFFNKNYTGGFGAAQAELASAARSAAVVAETVAAPVATEAAAAVAVPEAAAAVAVPEAAAAVAVPVATEAGTVAGTVAAETAGVAGTGAAVAGGIGAGTAAIGASLLGLLAYPKINQLLYGGISKDDLKVGNPSDVFRQKLIDTVSEYWSKIIDCDVAEGSYGGDLSDIADFENTKIIKTYADMLYVATTNPKMRDYPLKQITFDSIVKELAEAEDVSGGTWSARFTVGARDKRSVQTISSSPCVKESVGIFLTWMNDYIKIVKDHDSKPATTKAPSTGPAPTPPISGRGGSGPQGTSDSGYQTSSLIMKEKCYLKSVQSSWTPEFDAAFREFVDAGTATGKVPTSLVGGQEWSDVAGSLGVSPDKSGAFSLINSLAKVAPSKCSTSSAETQPTTAQPAAPSETKPVPAGSGDYPVLAAIIGAMYNQKLVGTPGFDLVKEPKRIQALVDAVGGANETGYGNAAKIIAKRNPAILSRLPKELTGPVDEVYAKNPANKALLQTIQVAINGIYDSAVSGSKTLGVFNPRLEKSTELVSAWLRSPAGGNWTEKSASNSVDQWVKLASERKMRIRAEVAAEMTPAERAAARRIKMREAV